MTLFFLMNSAIVSRIPSPMRMLRAWLTRERTVCGAATIALDVAARQVAREERIVGHASSSALEIDQRVECAMGVCARSLIDAQTPGVIDAAEARQLQLALIGVSLATIEHTKTFEHLK